MVEGIDAAIVTAYRAAKERGDRGTVRAVRELVAVAGDGPPVDFSSSAADIFSPTPLRAVASGDIKSPWDAISTD